MLLYIAFFIKVLTPAAELSKIFQDDIDIVTATGALNRIKHKLDLKDLSATKYLSSKVDKASGTRIYQGINFSSVQFENDLEMLKTKKKTGNSKSCI